MLNSMTGYGHADGQLEGICYAVEIKAVNNRYLKTMLRLPDAVAFLEEDIEKLIRQSLARGTINYVLRLKGVSANALFDIDEAALEAVVQRLSRIGAGVGTAKTLDIASLLALPGIVKTDIAEDERAARIRDLVVELTRKALEELQQMRAAEGRSLEADLQSHCDAIRKDLEKIGSRSSAVVKEYAKRLKKRVDELLSEAKLELDQETLAREVAILADRSDIAEEMARLDSHLQQFEEICRSNGQAGRRLDFLSQEMLREANTLASKAADAEIARGVVEIKCYIDRLKEQVQNVE